jgi:hypothetical protein
MDLRISGVVNVVDTGCAGPMDFFLFLNGRGFFPKRVAESCTRSQAGAWLVAACALEWSGLKITGFGCKLVRASVSSGHCEPSCGDCEKPADGLWRSCVNWNHVVLTRAWHSLERSIGWVDLHHTGWSSVLLKVQKKVAIWSFFDRSTRQVVPTGR